MPSLDDATRGRILFGGDYNPEQWPREVWQEDVRLMREAGVNLATVGVFSWAMLEPTPGERDFGWLTEVLDLLHANGIGVGLATPTASPPPWMGHRWPETLPRNPDGTVRTYGSRNAYCPSSPVFRALRRRDQPPTWPPCTRTTPRCGCGTSATSSGPCATATCAPSGSGAGSRPSTGTSTGLNEAWGTAFWSQRYSDWDEVIPPRQVQYVINPTQDLDYQRFASDLLLEGYISERDIVRGANPAVPVTTNSMSFFKGTDLWQLGRRGGLHLARLLSRPERARRPPATARWPRT